MINIQISVVIWTVICFLLLMFILKTLLFKPMLELMDKRRTRIDAATEKIQQAERLTKEHQLALTQKKQAAKQQAEAELSKKQDALRKDGKRRIEEARAKRLSDVLEFQGYADMRFNETLGSLDSEVKEIAKQLAQKLSER